MNDRNTYIDALRGLSIFVVLALHCWFIFPVVYVMPRDWFAPVVRNGYYGVTVFFVISGFLITSHAIKHYGSVSAINLQIFYRARFARIAPLLLATLALLVVLHLAGVPEFVAAPNMNVWSALWSALTFQFNLYYIGGASSGMIAWGPPGSQVITEHQQRPAFSRENAPRHSPPYRAEKAAP